MELTLRGLIFNKFRTITEFAAAAHWERNKASRIANGTQQPSKADMETLITVLGIPEKHVAPVFFGSMFTE